MKRHSILVLFICNIFASEIKKSERDLSECFFEFEDDPKKDIDKTSNGNSAPTSKPQTPTSSLSKMIQESENRKKIILTYSANNSGSYGFE